MMSKQAQVPAPKRKVGRPKKARTGSNIWVPAELLDSVTAYIAILKQQKQASQ